MTFKQIFGMLFKSVYHSIAYWFTGNYEHYRQVLIIQRYVREHKS